MASRCVRTLASPTNAFATAASGIASCALVHQPPNPQHEAARGVDRDLHVGDLVGDRLELARSACRTVGAGCAYAMQLSIVRRMRPDLAGHDAGALPPHGVL